MTLTCNVHITIIQLNLNVKLFGFTVCRYVIATIERIISKPCNKLLCFLLLYTIQGKNNQKLKSKIMPYESESTVIK